MLFILHICTEADALEWWQHGVISQDYSNISSFDGFSRHLVKRFNWKRENDLEQLTFLFKEGLVEPLQGMVKVSSPRSLDAIQVAYDLEPTMKSLKGGQTYNGSATQKTFADKEGPRDTTTVPPLRTKQLDTTTRRKMRE